MKTTDAPLYYPWLFRFAVLTALSTLGLIGMGGLVTSHQAGMAVPDWPTTYGYNMFLFPVSQWVGGVFYEHSHRLWASLVGLMTAVLAVWIWIRKGRGTLRWLGILAFVLVVFQGLLGGLRVVWKMDHLGIFHATLAQLFLILISGLALATSRWWTQLGPVPLNHIVPRHLRTLLLGVTALVLLQLALGATMRHQHAGLAVPDFPLAYGKLWPPMDEASLVIINQTRVDTRDFGAVTAGQIVLHMAHRIGAVLILLMAGYLAFTAWKRLNWPPVLRRGMMLWLGLILVQAGLGAYTVWTNKAADIATAHVVLGAISLVWSAGLTAFSCKFSVDASSDLLHSPPDLIQPDVGRHKPMLTVH